MREDWEVKMFDLAAFFKGNDPAGILVHAIVDDKNRLSPAQRSFNKNSRVQLKDHTRSSFQRRNAAQLIRPSSANATMNVEVELDTDVFAERGFWISGKDSPPKLTRVFDAEIFWLGATPLVVGAKLAARSILPKNARFRNI